MSTARAGITREGYSWGPWWTRYAEEIWKTYPNACVHYANIHGLSFGGSHPALGWDGKTSITLHFNNGKLKQVVREELIDMPALEAI